MSVVSNAAGSVAIAGVPFQVTTLDEAIAWLTAAVKDRDRPRVPVRLANAYCVALASKQHEYGRLLATSGVNFPDGAPVVAVMNALKRSGRRAQRVRGPSFFRKALEQGIEPGVRHFFLGSTPETLYALEDAATEAYPGIHIAGSYSPPFGEVDKAYLDELVTRAAGWDTDVVWVGMGTPKQDFVAQALADRAGVIAVGVGAGFDFLAGTVQEAPVWVQHSGLEWLYRFAMEPRRLWQRYIFGNARFLILASLDLLSSVRRRPFLH